MVNKKPKIFAPFITKNKYFNNKLDYLSHSGFNRIYNFFHTIIKEVVIVTYSLKQRFLDFFTDHSSWVKTSSIVAKRHDPVITWIGHSSFLIQMGGVNILTDPVFGNLTFLFKRIFKPGISFEKLPHIDYILISHNHRDHVDSYSLKLIKQYYPYVKILVPKGDKKLFAQFGFSRVVEFDWWEFQEITTPDNSIKFTFLPAKHWSGRNFFDTNKSLWGSWMIEIIHYRVYFAGDTAYWDHFKDIGERFGSIDIALMPIGPCSPNKWMKKSHLDARDAVRAFIDLQADYFVPMHWGTFYFGWDRFDTPVNNLVNHWKEYKDQLEDKRLMLLAIGEQIKIEKAVVSVNESEVTALKS